MQKFWICALIIIFIAACTPLFAVDGTEFVEGETYTVAWEGSPDAACVKVILSGERTPLGISPRGAFQIPVADKEASGVQSIPFRMPWIDAIAFTLRIKEFNANGVEVGLHKRRCRFRPRVMAKRGADGVYLDLHQKINQRLYVQKQGVITWCCAVSSSMNHTFLPPGRHMAKPHDHAGVFKVVKKHPSYWSSSYNVAMPWALNYNRGHFIHATSPRYYPLLGRPASHGCNRLTWHDARKLYLITPVGTRVEVIGPGG
ncbi:MAG: L,D-transpeptidase [Armatimonadota bacterium]|jgi:hypothetical protein